MKRDVYDPAQQSYRVQFAIAVMKRGGQTTRTFDTCFEMGDENEVAARIYARALKDAPLFAALPNYLNLNFVRESYHKVKHPDLPPIDCWHCDGNGQRFDPETYETRGCPECVEGLIFRTPKNMARDVGNMCAAGMSEAEALAHVYSEYGLEVPR